MTFFLERNTYLFCREFILIAIKEKSLAGYKGCEKAIEGCLAEQLMVSGRH